MMDTVTAPREAAARQDRALSTEAHHRDHAGLLWHVLADACCSVNACCTSSETAVDPALTVTQAKTASRYGCQS
ncbi:hypothetical protein [Streptomyces sp. ME19-01-6]|uniref:hypothetical protein n=1 Tax=Streptomyces sp. ME19-01-6 TaxID=3028686 RepID=UPI0029CA9A55|nr:hypothetical protein [Streptomyces sp. ME19-01-6]